MNKVLSFCILPAAMSFLACSADTNPPEPNEASASKHEVVQSKTQALTVANSCSPEMADKLRRIQTDLADEVWNAASNYENDPWTDWGIYSFNQPNLGQYQKVLDDLWTIALTLDSDRGLGGGIQYDCLPQGTSPCDGTTMAAADPNSNSDWWLVHICANFNSIENAGGADHGYAMQRAAVLHEYFHFLGYMDYGYCRCAINAVWGNAELRSPDNYQLFITGVNNVPSVCDIYPPDTYCPYPDP